MCSGCDVIVILFTELPVAGLGLSDDVGGGGGAAQPRTFPLFLAPPPRQRQSRAGADAGSAGRNDEVLRLLLLIND